MMRSPKAIFALGVALALSVPLGQARAASTPAAVAKPLHVNCAQGRLLCTEVADSDSVFGEGHYVGHDEPSLLFYSHQAGSGNEMQYSGIVPTDPAGPSNAGTRSYSFQLSPAFWFGMAMCDTQSFPLQIDTCTPDTDANIVPPTNPDHPGTAFTELQFYPPGWVQQFNASSCSATQWCVALNIDSLSENAVTGKLINPTCQQQGLVGVEPVNFAYLTTSGIPQGPPDPVHFDFVKSGRPDPQKVLFLNQGDHFTVTMHDTAHGLFTEVDDVTTGKSGSMTASAANGFAQVKFAPSPSTECTAIPYDFHPMYSTSTPQTRVPWAAHSYNIAFDDEIGHFDYCNGVPQPGGSCAGSEGTRGERADADDNFCFGPSESTRVRVGGCEDSNVGFDGTSYLRDWPDGSTVNRPSPILFTSPLTGAAYDVNYSQIGFESDTPRIEDPGVSPDNNCDRSTGAGCTRIPITDHHTPAAFYPYFSTGQALGGCAWTIGQDVAGFTTNNYGKTAQYGDLLKLQYINVGGGTVGRYNDFRNIMQNPCRR
jgi:hypothetical protein